MKVIKYRILQSTLENGDVITLQKEMPYSEINEEIVKAEAYKGDYSIEDKDVAIFGKYGGE